MRKADIKKRLSILFGLITFIVLIISMMLVGVSIIVLVQFEIVEINKGAPGVLILIFLMVASMLIGMLMYLFIRRYPFMFIHEMINGMTKLKEGKYDTRIYLGETQAAKNLADTFNVLANELANTEMLRTDFVNNFSHEFKTPIVSILGFSKMLSKGDIAEEKKKEYVFAIQEEAERLTHMSTAVLTLTKIENQEILSDKSEYNLSEQIRDSVLILEKNWQDKNISFNLDFDEISVCANQELLKQVWVNLIDNAIKYSEDYSEITVKITKTDKALIQIINYGIEIPEEERERIFNKFYQIDKSHSSKGNGIGLSIAKKIIDLHQGKIYAFSNNGVTTFTVELP